MSLPKIFRTTLESVPADIPYLRPEPEAVSRWAQWAAELPPGLRVGLVWAGNPRPEYPWSAAADRRRSMPLATLQPLASVPGVTFISLQKDAPAAELNDAPPTLSVRDPMTRVDDMADTAALLAHIDLVITVDTAMAHLAGALGKPVWVLLRYAGCWRWLQSGDASLWYPTMRLFRQDGRRDWTPVIETVATALDTYRRAGSRPPPC